MAGYQFHVSTDGGTTWSAPAVQNPVMVSAPGVRLVQFRAVDKAGNVSAWTPVSPDTSGTVKIDHTAPGTPVLTGGSLLWQNVASVDVTVGPLSDAGGSGLAADPLTVETSTDGGSTWSAETPAASATVSDEGGTLVRFRSHDAAGNGSPWAQAEVRIDRTAPSDPSLAGGSTSWFDSASMLVSASRLDRRRRQRHRGLPVRDLDRWRLRLVVARRRRVAGRIRRGRDARPVPRSRQRRADVRLGAGNRAPRPQRAVGAVAERHRFRHGGRWRRSPCPPPARSTSATPDSTTTSTRPRPTADPAGRLGARATPSTSRRGRDAASASAPSTPRATPRAGRTARCGSTAPCRPTRLWPAARPSWLNAASASLTASGATDTPGQRHRPLRV